MNLNPRIIIACAVGLLLVGGSYWLAQERDRATEHLAVNEIVAVAKPVRQFVPVTDTDNDGLPDWQRSFNLNTIDLDAEPEATPTKTAALTMELAALTTNPMGNMGITSLSQALTRDTLDTEYTIEDIDRSDDNSTFALRAYGNAVASIAIENAPPPGTESELTVLNRALLRNDPTILEGLAPSATAYEKMIADMLRTSVPSSLTREHLSLINVYQALLNDITAFGNTFDDALPAMLRFRRYQADVEALYLAISALYTKLDQSGITWTEADAASRFIKIE